jgi:hypothetical protein
MKKTLSHKPHLLKTSDNYNSQSSLTSALKAIVSSELKLDKKCADETCRNLKRTCSARRPSITTRPHKDLNHSSDNNSLIPEE